MFTAASVSGDMPLSDQIVQDIKYYDIDSVHVMISQVLVPEVSMAVSQHAAVQKAMDLLVKKKGLDLLVAAFTSVVENGSVFFAAGEKADKCREAFPDTDGPYTLQKDILSRKMQILPKLTKVIEE
jgi:manganese-dependent inorganic pyrophosphatase